MYLVFVIKEVKKGSCNFGSENSFAGSYTDRINDAIDIEKKFLSGSLFTLLKLHTKIKLRKVF